MRGLISITSSLLLIYYLLRSGVEGGSMFEVIFSLGFFWFNMCLSLISNLRVCYPRLAILKVLLWLPLSCPFPGLGSLWSGHLQSRQILLLLPELSHYPWCSAKLTFFYFFRHSSSQVSPDSQILAEVYLNDYLQNLSWWGNCICFGHVERENLRDLNRQAFRIITTHTKQKWLPWKVRSHRWTGQRWSICSVAHLSTKALNL